MPSSVIVLGTRGIPNVLGGVETHCQALYPELVRQFGLAITVLARSPYVPYQQDQFQGVALQSLPAPKRKSLEAILHSLRGVAYSWRHPEALVHVHAIGPGLVVPLLRLVGKKVVFTHHGPDYDRQKWGPLAKAVLRLGEYCAVRWAHEVIVISTVIQQQIAQQYGRHDSHLIYNGVPKPKWPEPAQQTGILNRWGLQAEGYLVAVGRFVEEKGFHDLIHAYQALNTTLPLVLVGDSDHETPYSLELKALIEATPNVIGTGFLQQEVLVTVFSQAKLFVMPSYHEGLPIALLEALSYSLPVVVSDIAANLAVELAAEVYFPVGDRAALTAKLAQALQWEPVDYGAYLARYDWPTIASQVAQVYQRCGLELDHAPSSF